MTKSIQHAIIIGATGLVGRSLVQQLNQCVDCEKITVLLRRHEVMFESLDKVKQVVLHDFLQLDRSQVEGYSHAFSCLGTTMAKAGSKAAFYHSDYEVNAHFAALLQTDTHYLLVSAMAADLNSRFFYNRVKGELEAFVRNLDLKCVSVLRPSLLLGERIEQRPLEQTGQVLFSKLAKLLPNRYRYKPVFADQVAATMLKAAQRQSDKFEIYDNLAIQNN